MNTWADDTEARKRASVAAHAIVGGWSDERVAMLKRLYFNGNSCSEIAKRLGGCTRNAVIGKLSRIGLSQKGVVGSTRRTQQSHLNNPDRAPKLPKPSPLRVFGPTIIKAAPNVPLPAELPEGPGLATILTLRAFMCRWPIGDPSADSFTFCGKGTSKTYCDRHARIAYQAEPKGRAKKIEGLARAYR